MITWEKHFEFIRDHDSTTELRAQKAPHALIQWKGTQACMDVHCTCGAHIHNDGDFFEYYLECPRCKRLYAVGMVVKLVELPEEHAAYARSDRDNLIKVLGESGHDGGVP